MARRTVGDIEKIWANVEGVKKLSDRVVGIGPFGIGLDGLLTWVPIVGTLYTVGAGAWLLKQAVHAKASPRTLARMAGHLGFDAVITVVGEVPFLDFVPNLIDTVLPSHLLAARALQAEIESTHWVEGRRADAEANGDHARHLRRVQDDPKLSRIVYLHD